MKTKLLIVAVISAMSTGMAIADGAALYAEKTCIACHGKEGKKPLTPAYPKLAGQNAAYLEAQMLDRLTVVDDLLERVDADAQVHIQIFLGDLLIARRGLDPAGCHRLV